MDFEGLSIHDALISSNRQLQDVFHCRPVLSFDFSKLESLDTASLRSGLLNQMEEVATDAGITGWRPSLPSTVCLQGSKIS